MRKTSVAIARVATIGLLAGTSLWFGPTTPAAADWLTTEKQLTTVTTLTVDPDVSGNRMVYSDYRNARDFGDPDDPDTVFDIRVQDLRTGKEKILTPKHDAYSGAAISGNRVVWQASTGKKWSLWYHNLSSGTHKKLPINSAEYRIDGKRLCYTASNGRIYVYNLSTKKKTAVSPKGKDAGACDISGTTVVWQSYDASTDFDIYSYNLSTKKRTRITSDTHAQVLPRIDGRVIVWADERGGLANDDIYMYNLGTRVTSAVTTQGDNQSSPAVSAGRVTYETWTGEELQLHLYDIATGIDTHVGADGGSTWNAAISGNRIVYEGDRIGGAIHLFLRTITAPVVSISATASVPKGLTPAITGNVKDPNGNAMTTGTVRLEYSTNGKTWTSGDSATMNMSGMFAIVGPAITRATWFRVRFEASLNFAPAVSSKVKVKVI